VRLGLFAINAAPASDQCRPSAISAIAATRAAYVAAEHEAAGIRNEWNRETERPQCYLTARGERGAATQRKRDSKRPTKANLAFGGAILTIPRGALLPGPAVGCF